jgi:hypothetical protein
MKPAVWLAGLILLAAFVFPNGVALPRPPQPVPAPVIPEPVKPTVPPDADIVRILATAAPAEKARIAGVYTGLKRVVQNDTEKLLTTTEQTALAQARTLQLATGDMPIKGKYVDLDKAIEAVFARKLGKELDRDDKEVAAVDDKIRAKIVEACDVVIASVQ